MKGIVEIYSGDKLLYQDDNLVVDGAGQTIVDMLTMSPSLSGIASTSSLLDTSNYTIQAISFGKGKKAYLYNAHAYDSSSELGINTKDLFLAVSGSSLLGTNKGVAVVVASSLTTSSYSPVPTLPAATTPMDTKLAEGAYLSGNSVINLDTTQYKDGQNMNILPYINEEGFTAGFEGYGSYWGCWPEGSGTGGSNFYVISSTDVIESTLTTAHITNALVSGTYKGVFNAASSMETRGWVGKVYDPINGQVGLPTETNPISGLIVSSSSDSSTTGEVQYIITCGSGDLGMANLYGGIYSMGLWTIDISTTLAPQVGDVGYYPPFGWHPYNKPRRNYRLFSKHSFTKNLCYIQDYDDGDVTTIDAGALRYQDLTIVWRIKFL